MQRLMAGGVKVVSTSSGMEFDGAASDAIVKATRDAILAFMAHKARRTISTAERCSGKASKSSNVRCRRSKISIIRGSWPGVTCTERQVSKSVILIGVYFSPLTGAECCAATHSQEERFDLDALSVNPALIE